MRGCCAGVASAPSFCWEVELHTSELQPRRDGQMQLRLIWAQPSVRRDHPALRRQSVSRHAGSDVKRDSAKPSMENKAFGFSSRSRISYLHHCVYLAGDIESMQPARRKQALPPAPRELFNHGKQTEAENASSLSQTSTPVLQEHRGSKGSVPKAPLCDICSHS